MLPPAKPPPAKNAVTAAFSHRTPPAKNSVCGRTPGGACTVREIGAPVRPYAAVSDAQAFALPLAGIGSVRNYPAHEVHSYPAYEMPNIIPRTECKFVSA